MNIRMGEKIKSLRKARNLSQEALASQLGVSFQAVSKWENGASMPDVAMIPAIASFFRVSTDDLFDFNAMENEKRVMELCYAAAEIRSAEPAKAEAMLRQGLKQYPGNDIILNNLLYTMRGPERCQEVVDLCLLLAESTRHDDVKYDALRICAETYKEMGEYALCKATIARIPEIYFSKLELDAMLLEGEDMASSAQAQKNLSAETLVDMLLRLADYYEGMGNVEKARVQLKILCDVVDAMAPDVPLKEDNKGFCEYYGNEAREKARVRLKNLA